MRYRHFNVDGVSVFILGSDIEGIDDAKEMFPSFFGKTTKGDMMERKKYQEDSMTCPKCGRDWYENYETLERCHAGSMTFAEAKAVAAWESKHSDLHVKLDGKVLFVVELHRGLSHLEWAYYRPR